MAGVPTAYHLLILPQDLRTGDPSFAVELYDGYFGLAGAAAPIGSESPFHVLPPSVPWQKDLYAFAWLRHLHAAGDQIAREKARKLASEWIAFASRAPALARDRDITARRVIAVLSHASFLLDGADPAFYDSI
ncbi:MAG: heparinase, partial [Rhodomicrobium sp.]